MGLTDWFERHISNISYSISASLAACGAFNLQEWALIVGIVAAIVTCIVNWYYRRKSLMILKNIKMSEIYEEINH